MTHITPSEQRVNGSEHIFSQSGNVTVNQVSYALLPAEGNERANLLALIQKVRHAWIAGVLESALHGAAPLSIGRVLRPDLVTNPLGSVIPQPHTAGQIIPGTASVDTVFEQTGRSLLLLGDAGAGKTIALVELARARAVAAELDPTQPVPVILSLSAWSTRQGACIDWLAAEMQTRYLVPRKLSQSWLEQGRLLLLLDGLDEAPSAEQDACVDAINSLSADAMVPAMAVTGRLVNYAGLEKRLRLNSAVVLQPLEPEEIDRYLASGGDDSAVLRGALQRDAEWAELARSPLMLWVMAQAYTGPDAQKLLQTASASPEARQRLVFASYVERMFARKPAVTQIHSREMMTHSLAWIARQMDAHGHSLLAVEQLQPSWLERDNEQRRYLLKSRLAAAALAWVVSAGVNNAQLLLGDWNAILRPFLQRNYPIEPDLWVRMDRWGLLVDAALIVVCGVSAARLDWSRWRTRKNDDDVLRTRVGRFGLSVLVWLSSISVAGVSLVLWFHGRPGTPATDIQVVESLRWATANVRRRIWTWGRRAGAVGAITCLLLAYFPFRVPQPPLAPRMPVWVDVATALTLAAVGGIIGSVLGPILCVAFGGITTAPVSQKMRPNEGVVRSARNGIGLLVALMLPMSLGMSILVSRREAMGPTAMPAMLTAMGWVQMLSVVLAFWFGGYGALKHFVLRQELASRRYVPLRVVPVLDAAVELILLQRVGGSYRFIHRRVQEYLASLASA